MTAENKASPQWPQIDDLYDPTRWAQPERGAAKHAAAATSTDRMRWRVPSKNNPAMSRERKS